MNLIRGNVFEIHKTSVVHEDQIIEQKTRGKVRFSQKGA
jgi:hypothetical protein